MLAHLQKIRKEEETGFTLIELLVVILIVGVLAGIAIPMFLSQRKSAVDAATVSDTHALSTAIETKAVSDPDYSKMSAATFSDVPLSSGTTWSMTSNSSGYCLLTYNAGGDQYKDVASAATYDSTNGGLNKTGGECGGTVAAAAAPSSMTSLGTVTFLDSDNPANTITADGSAAYDGSTQTLNFSFTFKALDPSKTYYILFKAEQSQGTDITQRNNAFGYYALAPGSTQVQGSLILKGSNGPVLSAPDKVDLLRGFSMNPGYGAADIYDPAPLTIK